MKTILSIIALFSAIVAPNATIENIPYETYYSIRPGQLSRPGRLGRPGGPGQPDRSGRFGR